MSGAMARKAWTSDDLSAPPRVDEAERAILGAILLDNAAIERVRDRLRPQDFYATAHQIIYREMLELADAGEVIDHVVLTERLRASNQLGNVRGTAYIAELIIETVSAANIASHARLVSEKSRIRKFQAQAITLLTEIERGADLDKVLTLLPDVAEAHEPTGGSASTLSVVSASALLDNEEIDSKSEWLLDSLIQAGSLVGFIAKPKVGKTTLVYEMAVKIAQGLPFLGRTSRPSAVLVLALEEHRREVQRRLRSLGAENLNNLHLVIGSLDADRSTFVQLKRTVEKLSIKLIIIDTLNSFWRVEDENDAAQVTVAIKPLLNLARSTNAAIIVIHHARKSEGEFGDEIRGSGAFFSLLDAAFILKRHDGDFQRKLTAISRWPETPTELIVELRDHGYECLGDAATAGRLAKLEKLAFALTLDPQTARELATKAGVPFRSAYGLVEDLVKSGRASRLGSGRRGDPFRFVPIDRGAA